MTFRAARPGLARPPGVSRVTGASLAAGLAALAGLLLGGAGCAPARDGAERPNVLFLIVDDLRPELGCYGRPAATPRIDALAAEGVRFDRAYCQVALCQPSRASVLLGRRPATTGVWGFGQGLRDRVGDAPTLPQLFREAGYATAAVGKVEHEPPFDAASWSVPPWTPEGGQHFWALPASRAVAAAERARIEASGRAVRGTQALGPPTEAADLPDDAYPDGQVAGRALELLRELRDEPFFLAVGFYKPHLPFVAPRRYWDLHDPAAVEVEYAPPRAPVPAVATRTAGEVGAYAGVTVRRGERLPPDLERHLAHGYRACASFVDAQVGRVLDELERLGLAERTVVVLWGDHGYHLGEHGLWTKFTNFEVAARAPLVVRAPGGARGATSDALVELVDLFPTLADLAGLDASADLEGASFAPLLAEPGRPWKRAAFTEFRRGDGTLGRSVRTARHRLTTWTTPDGTEVGLELYDHATDPAELENLATDPAHATTVTDLRATLAAGWRGAVPPVR